MTPVNTHHVLKVCLPTSVKHLRETLKVFKAREENDTKIYYSGCERVCRKSTQKPELALMLSEDGSLSLLNEIK